MAQRPQGPASAGFEDTAPLILADLRSRVGLNGWWVARRDGDDQIIVASDGGFGVVPGVVIPWEDTLCARMLDGRAPTIAPDVDDVPAYVEVREQQGIPLGAVVSIPLFTGSGELLATLCGVGQRPQPDLEDDLPVIELQGRILAALLGHELMLAAEGRRQQQRLGDPARADRLTGVGNRAAWDAALSAEEARAARYATTASVLVVDLDDLRRVNETSGHDAGDRLLVRTARVLEERIRSVDVVCRLRGDEFGLLLPETAETGARTLVTDLRQRLSGSGIAVSVGVAQRRGGAGLIEAWRRADADRRLDVHRDHPAGPLLLPAPRAAVEEGAHELPTTVEALLDLLRAQLGMDVAFVSVLEGDRRRFRNVVAAVDVPIGPGLVEPAEGTYCQLLADGVLPAVIPDTRREPLVRDLPHTRERGIGAYLGVPLHRRSGELYGTLCAWSGRPDPTLTEHEAGVLRAVSGLLMRMIEAEDAQERRRHDFLRQMDALLAAGGPSMVYQPIHRLASLAAVGHEGLSRFPAGSPAPSEWFAAAAAEGAGEKLELAAVSGAVRALPYVEGFLAVNVSPATLLMPGFLGVLDGLPLDRLVLEVTEHQEVQDYAALADVLRPLRTDGLRIAVDDVGAGFASMHHVLALVPDFVKLDISLVRGIDADHARQALAVSLAAFAGQTNAIVIAEGIETESELACLRELRIDLGQGFHLSRPEPLPEAVYHRPFGARV